MRRDAKDWELEQDRSYLRIQADLESANDERRALSHQLWIAKGDIDALSKINDELQSQLTAIKDREEKNKDEHEKYKDKIHELEYQREKLRLKEETFQRQLSKSESEF